MKSCPICGAPNPDEGVICERCGASLVPIPEGEILCPVCGYRNPSGSIFCEQCGARLAFKAALGVEEPSGGETSGAAGVELDWVATLQELFPELSSEVQPFAPAAAPVEAGREEEIASPPSAKGEGQPSPEAPPVSGEWLGEGFAPPSPESAPWMPSGEEIFPVFEPEPPAEGASVPQGIPTEAAPPWPSIELSWEEKGSFPFLGGSPVQEGEEGLSFPWLEPEGEAPEKGSGVSQPEAMPSIEGPPELGMEGSPASPRTPFVGFPEETGAAAPPESGAGEIPEWLRGLEGAEGFWGESLPVVTYEPLERGSEESLLTTLGIPVEEELFPQTSSLRVQEERLAETPPVPEEIPPFTDLEAVLAEMPEWLHVLQPAPEEGQAPSVAISALEPAVVETQGPLAGLIDVLPLNPRLAEIQGPAAQLRSEPAPELLARAQAWQGLLSQGLNFLVGERAVEPIPAGLGAALERWLLFVLLIGALVIGLYWPLPLFQPGLLNPPADFLAQLDQAPPGGIALVAVDYGPDRAAELEMYLHRILERLADRGVRVLTVSLSPWGAAQAALMVQARPDYGERVVHLGYYPGQEVGVARLLTRPLRQLGVDYRGQPVAGLPLARDFGEEPLAARLGLVVLITGSPDALRGWIQQAWGVLPPEVPMVAAVGANLAPYVAPYQESGQLQAVAIGLRDALLLDGPAPEGSPAFLDLQAQTVLQLVIIGLIGMGLILRLFRSPTASER